MPGQAFISYVHEDKAIVDELQRVLESAGIPVWRDKGAIGPGQLWWEVIHRAITEDALVFIACFSEASVSRHRTVQREELLLAIDEYRRRRPERPWLIPVRLSDCDLPPMSLGGGRTLASLDRVDLFGDRWDEGCARLVATIRELLRPEEPTDPRHRPRSTEQGRGGPHSRAPGDDSGRQMGRRISRRKLVAAAATATAAAATGGGVWLRQLTRDPDTDDGGAEQQADVLTGHRDLVTSVAFSPDGSLLATGSADTTAKLWDVRDRRRVASLGSHEGWVRTVAFSGGDGSLLATGSADRTVGLWAPRTHQKVAALRGHTDEVWSVVFSPEGRLLASGGEDTTVRLWDPINHEAIAVLTGHREWILSVAFSREGELLASGSGDGTVRLWDTASHEEVAVLRGHTAWVVSVAFSPTADILATASQDNTVRLWDPTTHDEIAVVTGHSDQLEAVAFSPNGRRLATAGGRTVRLWNPATQQQITMFTAHRDKVRAVAFSPSSDLLATGSEDKTVRLWPATDL